MSEEKKFEFRDHVKPVSNVVILQPQKIYRSGDVTESGLIIARGDFKSSTPEADTDRDLTDFSDSLGFKVVTVGKDVTRVETGDYVMLLPGSQFYKTRLFGDDYFVVYDYSIMAILSKEADDLNYEMNKEAREREETIRNVSVFNKFLNTKEEE